MNNIRLTQYGNGGGCSCKIPPDELESMVAGLSSSGPGELLVGIDHGEDAAVIRMGADGHATVATTDFFTPVVADA